MVLLAAAWIGYFLLHSWLAASVVKDWLWARIPSLERSYRLIYNLWAIISLLLVVRLQGEVVRNRLWPIAEWHAYVGVLLVSMGAALGWLALRQYSLGEFSGLAQWRKKPFPDHLNTAGLNAYMRHPLYTATLLFIWGWFVNRGTDVALLVASIWTGYLYLGTLWEERKLRAAFGEAYIQYQHKVKRFIPFLF